MATAQEIRALITLLFKYANRAIEERLAAHGAPITSLQYGIMRTIAFEPLTLTELSRQFNLDPSTLVPSIDALERKGLLRRERDAKDRRRLPLSLTEPGVELLQSVPPIHNDDAFMVRLHAMGADKIDALHRMLFELVSGLPQGDDLICDMHQRMKIMRAYEQAQARTHHPGQPHLPSDSERNHE